MSLYGKYRPAKWSDVVGQAQVVRVLDESVKSGKFAHAYLFSGSRGTGKTSIARIFARAIGTSAVDTHEMDAASNRGIDEIRELREGVRSKPFESPHKVYIIDEAHMLTSAAFNALLKTLEEPPPHAIFILATTEAHKLPETIVSRCQHFTFKRPSEQDIIENLENVAKGEGYKLEAGALSLIALLSEGSYRDSLTILEKVLTISKDKKVDLAEVREITGAPAQEDVSNFLLALAESDRERALGVLAGVHGDFKVFLKLVLRAARNSMLVALAPDIKNDILRDVGEDEAKLYASLGRGEGAKRLPNVMRALLSAYNDVGYSYIPSLPIELAVIDLCQ